MCHASCKASLVALFFLFMGQRIARGGCEDIEVLQFQQRPNGKDQPNYQCAHGIEGSENSESLGIECIAELDGKVCVDALEGVDSVMG